MSPGPLPSLLACLLLALPAAARAQETPAAQPVAPELVGRVAVLYQPPADQSARRTSLFYRQLLSELAKLEDVEPVDPRRQPTPLEDTCAADLTCLGRLVAAMGAERVVLARTLAMEESKVLSLRRVRTNDLEVEEAVTRRMVGGDGEEYLMALGGAVAELFPDRVLRPGAVRGVQPDVVARWTPPPVPRWGFYAVAISAIASGATTIAFGVAQRRAQDHANHLVALSATQPIDGRELMDARQLARDRATQTNWALGVTALLGVATGVVGWFTDWHPELDSDLLGP